MLSRLGYLRLAPRCILDGGSGPGREAAMLHARYPKARLIRVDLSFSMLREGRRRFFERKQGVCADLAKLPFAPATFDFIWSNMALHWATDPVAWLGELARVSAPEGLIMFSTLGPDTLKELRAAAGAGRVHEFVDMHDLGDMLVEAGYAAPVMDMEMITVAYPHGRGLLDDLKASGQTNARADRARGLARGALRTLAEGLGKEASFEVVYGHAWKGVPRKLPDGRGIVQFHSRNGETRGK